MKFGGRTWSLRLALAGLAAFAALSAQAVQEVVGNLRWEFDINASKTVTALGVELVSGTAPTTLTVPAKLGGRAVTCLGEGFAPGFEGVTTLALGDDVTEIGDGVFDCYESLRTVTGGKNLRKVGFDTFNETRFRCGDKYIDSSFADEEEEAAYYNGLELVYVGTFVVGRRGELANAWDERFYTYAYDKKYGGWVETWTWEYRLALRPGTTGIAAGVFADLPVTDVALPDSVAVVGDGAFESCCHLKSLSFGAGLREIGAFAFADAGTDYEWDEVWSYSGPAITSLTFPASLERIGDDGFACFALLKYVSGLGPGVRLGEDNTPDAVFYGTPYLEGWDAPRLDCDGRTVWGLSWESGFDDGCVTNGVLTIPAGVTTIEEGALAGLYEVTRVVLPASLTTIGDCAFEDCYNLTSVSLPASLKTIGEGAFSCCENLKTVTGGSGLERVGYDAFRDTRFLCGDACIDGFETWEEEEAYYQKLVPVYAGTFCVGHRGGLYQAWDDEYYTDDGDTWTWTYTLTLKAGTTGIADGAFANSELAITKLVLPDSLRFIGASAFEDCCCLGSITFGTSLERVGDWAFGCAGHDEYIKSGVLKSLTFPDSLVSLGEGAFYGASYLTKVTFEGDAPKCGEDCFYPNDDRDEDCGQMSVVAYSDTWGWPKNGSWQGFPLTFVDRPVPPEVAKPVAPPPPPPDVATVPAAGIVGAVANAKAMTVRGVVLDGLHVVGSVEIAVGKPGAKGTKLGGSVTLFGGKKLAAKAPNVNLASGAQTVVFAVKDLGAMTLKVGAQADGTVSFTGTLGSYVVTSARIGGETVAAATFGLPEGFAAQLQGGAVNADLLPDGLPVQMNGKKWLCPKTGTVAYKKDKATGQMAWVLNGGKDDPAKTNFAALKLSYAPKTGAFKGSFKAYSLVGGKLKKTTVALAGVFVDGSAFGSATVKKLGSWRVVVE